MKEGSGIGNDWILEHVVPLIKKNFHEQVALVLGLPLLWACLDSTHFSLLPDDMVSKVTSEYRKVRILPEDESPVIRNLLLVTGNEGTLNINPSQLGIGENGESITVNSGMEFSEFTEHLASMRSTLIEIGSQNALVNEGLNDQLNKIDRQLMNIGGHIRRNEPYARLLRGNQEIHHVDEEKE